MPPKFAPKGRALFTHFHALAAVTVSIRLSYSRGSPVLVRPRGSIPISLPCRALTARGSLERQFRNGTRPGHRFHVFLICVYYITIKPVCQPQILPRLAALRTLFPKSPCAGGEEISPRYSFKGGLRAPFVSPRKGKVSPAGSVGAERSPPESCAPLQPLYEAGLRPPRTPRKGVLGPGLLQRGSKGG